MGLIVCLVSIKAQKSFDSFAYSSVFPEFSKLLNSFRGVPRVAIPDAGGDFDKAAVGGAGGIRTPKSH